ncbi:TadE/TadG family type IV pilus assembly protein [Bradyrhizobium sp.]|uniref:TadE/TadG family type IV pilus assembly protein n=1 Tax=Bradyrhizobium sp. TaxID=376 RepID=UPI003C7950FF
MSRIGFRILRSALDMFRDRSAIAATEFAVIVPIMLVMFFGTVEFSSGVAVDRKVTLVARTLSDLTSQAPSSAPQATYANVNDSYLQNVFTASISMFQPYPPTPTNATISEIYVDSSNVARIQWSKAATIGSGATQATLVASSRNPGDVVTTLVPPALLVKQTYLILSEVSYLYVPTIGYVMVKTGVTMSDVAYTRPRQVTCLIYNNLLPAPSSCPLT